MTTSALRTTAAAIFTPTDTHATLERQLRRLGLGDDVVPDEHTWPRLLAAISQAYSHNDIGRYTTERAMQLSAREMRELHLEISERERRLRFVLAGAGFGLAEYDFKTKRLKLDDFAVEILRLTEDWESMPIERLIGRFQDEDADAFRSAFLRVVASERQMIVPLRVRVGEDLVHLEARMVAERDAKGRPQRIIGMITDVTERVRAEGERHQSQKLESIGQLAAGIAHEINTPIQFVSDSLHFVSGAATELLDLAACHENFINISLSGQRPTVDQVREAQEAAEDADLEYLHEQVPKAITRALEGLDRVATIVRSLKEFAHPDGRDMAHVDLNRGIDASLTIARNEYKYVAELVVELGELPPVMCHAGDINQVVLNIVVNAAHAISDRVEGTQDRGVITVRTFEQDGEAVITIADTGGGIPTEVQDRIFDPFFTTKEIGRGTGQGLAISRTVVDKHSGTLTFDTEPGVGTTFTIRLPLEGTS
jgi:signal transduction histidine kinase